MTIWKECTEQMFGYMLGQIFIFILFSLKIKLL